MAREATGAPRYNRTKQVWEARVSIPGHDRKSVPMAGIPACVRSPACRLSGGDLCPSCAKAVETARRVSKRVRELGAVPVEAGETTREWFDRWIASRVARGLKSTGDDRGRYTKWIDPIIGTKPIAAVTRRDLELVVEKVDGAVAAKELGWKTAINVWGIASKMFADACRSKKADLRVRDDNPARDVEGPDRGVERSGPYLFPAELQALVACKRVPPRWKRLAVLATYLYVRRGELGALAWTDVSLERGYVHVHQQLDRKGALTPTKTKDTRKVPIEPTLVPLLQAMRDAAGGEGRVCTSMPPMEEMARRLRRYVAWACEDAGIPARAELFADDETRRQLAWHDLRHSGITWRAVRGDEPLKVQRAAGHSDLKTTQRYINEANVFEDVATFGVPFPSLDLEALTAVDTAGAGSKTDWARSGLVGRAAARMPGNIERGWRPQRDSKTVADAAAPSSSGDLLSITEGPEIPAKRMEAAITLPHSSAIAEAPHLDGDRRQEVERSAGDDHLDEEGLRACARPMSEPTSKARHGGARSSGPADEAVRAAAKLAIDHGDFARATALLALLEGESLRHDHRAAASPVEDRDTKPSNVVALAGRRRR